MAKLDQGYAWVVLTAAILQHLLYACPLGVLGIFLVEIKDHFKCSKSQITLLAMLSFVVGMLLAYPIGKLTQRFGTRRMSIAASLLAFTGYASSAYSKHLEVLYLVFGALTSISHYAQYVVDIAAVQQWFDRRRGLAVGLLMAAASVGSFMWPPLGTYLIQAYGWQGAIFIISGMQLNGIVFGLFMKPLKTKKMTKLNEVQNEVSLEKPSLRQKARWFSPFALLLPSAGLIQAGYFVYITYLPMRMNELGMEKNQVSLLFSLIGASGILLRPLVGVFGDFAWVSRVLFYGVCAILGGSLTMASVSFHSATTMAIYAVGCGVTSAGYMGVQAALAVDLLGRKYNEAGTGAVVTSMGIAHTILHPVSAGYMAIQPALCVDLLNRKYIEVGTGALVTALGIAHSILHPVSGWLMDAYKDTALPFCIFGASQLLGGIIAAGVWLLQRRVKNSNDLKVEISPDAEYKSESDVILTTLRGTDEKKSDET